MRLGLLEVLQCPSCRGSLSVNKAAAPHPSDTELQEGLLACRCSRYPVVAGIPVLLANHAAREAVLRLEVGHNEEAFFLLLGLRGPGQERLRRLAASAASLSFRQTVQTFGDPPDRDYFIYRFADPTFRVSVATLEALCSNPRSFSRPVLDLCGGTGHLTRALCRASPGSPVILADADFWKVWLSKRITAPDCLPVCCKAGQSLPFKSNAFSLIVCSDAFHYIGSKDLLAREIERVLERTGLLVMNHLHNALCENYSPGTPLAPEGYRKLFSELGCKLYKETALLDELLARQILDLSRDCSDRELHSEAALLLIASRLDGVFRSYRFSMTRRHRTATRINPLYQVEQKHEEVALRLRFPSAIYEMEFGACKRYLPARVKLNNEAHRKLCRGDWDGTLEELAERCVLLDLPDNYL